MHSPGDGRQAHVLVPSRTQVVPFHSATSEGEVKLLGGCGTHKHDPMDCGLLSHQNQTRGQCHSFYLSAHQRSFPQLRCACNTETQVGPQVRVEKGRHLPGVVCHKLLYSGSKTKKLVYTEQLSLTNIRTKNRLNSGMRMKYFFY